MFSEREQKIINIIGRKKVTLEYINSELFKDDKVFDGTIKVANSISRINKKCLYNSCEWILHKTRDNGKLLIKKEKV